MSAEELLVLLNSNTKLIFIAKILLTLIKLGFLRVVFPGGGGGGQFDTPSLIFFVLFNV